jgi:hypothetical protein
LLATWNANPPAADSSKEQQARLDRTLQHASDLAGAFIVSETPAKPDKRERRRARSRAITTPVFLGKRQAASCAYVASRSAL